MMNNLRSIWNAFSFPPMEPQFDLSKLNKMYLEVVPYKDYCVWAMQHHYHEPLATKYLCAQNIHA